MMTYENEYYIQYLLLLICSNNIIESNKTPLRKAKYWNPNGKIIKSLGRFYAETS